jgi:hypothetical protein
MAHPEAALSDYQRLLDLWRGRLLEARKNYGRVVGELQNARTDFKNGTLPAPDGSANMASALRAETQTLNEYMRILKIFTDLVISGKAPEEEQAKRGKDGNHSPGR